ncbi:MAG: putative O-succinylbenzoate--CoA ligase (OSB-CoA synthetase) (O-succinylbenzoyl-CoA synthetase) [Acidimicrobiales bacterium]|jgi:fatty-acyl-CoA synthase|nr:putative O-succinylbenzoate--CoA ligase (OSB-CoA synthetase) (O-succinylbenzoyl-CoA synthetase) [Acidimicrobiales bacterium]
MNLAMLLEMAADGFGDRVAVGDRSTGLTYRELLDLARGAAALFEKHRAERVVVVDQNSDAVPIALFGAALAGTPFVPVNYRLADDRLRDVLARAAPAVAIVGPDAIERVRGIAGLDVMARDDFLEAAAKESPGEPGFTDPDDVAVMLFTSGTTGEPKAAVLRHRHLTSYVISTVEFMGAGPDEAALVSVPPYHIAGISAVLSSVYTGRRIVYLSQFTADEWSSAARDQAITHAMVVPTMLTRILDAVDAGGDLPALRHLSYGGGRMPVAVIERALTRLPGVGFVNAYGLTETSSTIAVLTPDDHAAAFGSGDPAARARLGSVGRPLPVLEVEIRDESGGALGAGEHGEIWVRGEQVAGEYLGRGTVLTDDGWFPTNDGGWLDADGFLFVDGRLDDVIVRGGENLSPGEIEDVLLDHDAVAEAAVVGVRDDEWGEVPAAAVVLAPDGRVTAGELQDWVRARLRSTRVPDRIAFVDELPYNETGKLLRRVLKDELSG